MMEFDTQKLIEMRRHLRGLLSLVESVLNQRGELRCADCNFKHKPGECSLKTRTFMGGT